MPTEFDFKTQIDEILSIPGVTQKRLAEWASVDASTVTRWAQGSAAPHDPVAILQRLRPYVDRAIEEVSALRRNEVDSWRSLVGDMSPGLREHVEQTGLLASAYYVLSCWIPSSQDPHEADVVVVRWFDGVWADMSRRVYNLGDLSQTVSFSDTDGPKFDQFTSLTPSLLRGRIDVDKEVGRSVARLHVQVILNDLPYSDSSIGFVEGFGYRYRATKAIVRQRIYPAQTNDFLGAPIVMMCRRFQLVVCIPRACFRGSPSALGSSNRSMLKVLMELDNTDPNVLESLLWPQGRHYEMSSSPDSPLKSIARVSTMIDSLPHGLQEALKQPADLENPASGSIRDALSSADSTCFLLDLHNPHPSLTHTIVWRLRDLESSRPESPLRNPGPNGRD